MRHTILRAFVPTTLVAALLLATCGCQPSPEGAKSPDPAPESDLESGPVEPEPPADPVAGEPDDAEEPEAADPFADEPDDADEPVRPVEEEEEPAAAAPESSDESPEPEPPAEPEMAEEPAGEPEAELKELDTPLVENVEGMQRLDEKQPIWLDMKGRQVVMIGRICQTDAPLELFACLDNTKEHEAVVSLGIEAFLAHTGLLALGADPGQPVRWDPKYEPAAGTEIEVLVRYKDAEGNIKTAQAQDWVYDVQNKKAMEHPWVFAGSGFWVDEETKRKHYRAEEGDFICVSNFSSAMLDLPIESSQANNALMFKAYTERIPPLGTPVTVLLRPKFEQQPEE